MFRLKNILLTTLGLMLGNVAVAQAPVLTLEQAMDLALRHNYDIRLSKNDSSLAALDYAYSIYAFVPRLSAAGGVLYNINAQRQTFQDNTERSSTGIRSRNLTGSVNLDWTVFDGGKMFVTRHRLRELLALGELEIKNQITNSLAQVMQRYFAIVAQEQQLTSLKEQMQLSQDRLALARLKFEVGTGVKPDVLQAEIDYNNQRATYMATEAEAEKLKTQLNVLMGVSPRATYRVADTAINNDRNLLPDSSMQTLVATNPALQLAAQRVTVTGLQLRERKAELWPSLSLNSAYNFNRTNNSTVINPYSPLFNQNAGFNYGVTASVPIFNGFSARRNIKAAELDVAYQTLNYERTKDTVENALLTAWRNYDLYTNTVQLQEENLKLVRENLLIARERYRIGISTFIEMREAEQNLATANNSLIQARYQAKLAEIELLRLTGGMLR